MEKTKLVICGTQVLVHVDLKGAPPKLSYLQQFFPYVRALGATGVLLEWEDAFPYNRDLIRVGSLSASSVETSSPYSVDDAKQLLKIASDCNLLVIPLVQTFGHLEFVLKHDEWRHLREVESYPSSMCPLKTDALPLINNLIQQIVNFHFDLQYIHIGADEVWHLGICSECSAVVQHHKHGKAALFLDHVINVANFIKQHFPQLNIIMWDDMLV